MKPSQNLIVWAIVLSSAAVPSALAMYALVKSPSWPPSDLTLLNMAVIAIAVSCLACLCFAYRVAIKIALAALSMVFTIILPIALSALVLYIALSSGGLEGIH